MEFVLKHKKRVAIVYSKEGARKIKGRFKFNGQEFLDNLSKFIEYIFNEASNVEATKRTCDEVLGADKNGCLILKKGITYEIVVWFPNLKVVLIATQYETGELDMVRISFNSPVSSPGGTILTSYLNYFAQSGTLVMYNHTYRRIREIKVSKKFGEKLFEIILNFFKNTTCLVV